MTEAGALYTFIIASGVAVFWFAPVFFQLLWVGAVLLHWKGEAE